MSQTVHFQGNPVTVANSIPQAGSKAQTFTLVAKDLSDVTVRPARGHPRESFSVAYTVRPVSFLRRRRSEQRYHPLHFP